MAVRNYFNSPAKGAAWAVLAVALIAPFEGYAPHPYVDRVGTGRPVTWCYGETKADGPVPDFDKVFTKAECEQQLINSLPRYSVPLQRCIPKFNTLPPHRQAALVSAAYNLGPAALCRGPIAHNINAGNTLAGCNALLAYTHAQGRVLAGLVRRRQAERAWCLRSD